MEDSQEYKYERPYRCDVCGRIFYFAGNEADKPQCIGYYGDVALDCYGNKSEPVGAYSCSGTGTFAGLSDWYDTAYTTTEHGLVSVRLNEGHKWEQDGMFNPHAVPMRDTPKYAEYVREGKIVMHNGVPCLYSRNREEYKKTLSDLGYTNTVGDGELSRRRQEDQRRG